VLSPLWISGILLLAPVLCVLLVLLGWYIRRRATSIASQLPAA